MRNIRLWTPESDFDSKTVTTIAEKIKRFYQCDIKILQGSQQAYQASVKKDNGLQKQVNIYLKSSDLIIFLIDADGVQASEQRKREPNSMINKITELVNQFPDRVKLILMKQELEARLLVDCLGICCYYLNNDKLRDNQDWIKFAKKYQKGNTELITEAEQGGRRSHFSFEKMRSQLNITRRLCTDRFLHWLFLGSFRRSETKGFF
jgi:hypothetical protein